MADIDKEVIVIPKKLSFSDSVSSEPRSRASTVTDMLGVDYHTSISSVIPPIQEESNENNAELPSFSVRQIYKNLIILSIALVLTFTAYNGITTLQSSLNTKGNVGLNSLIVNHAVMIFSAIFLTGISIDIFGLKWTIFVAEAGYIFYILANIRPTPLLMNISAALAGLASPPLWTAQAIYIARLARYYAHHKQKKLDLVVSLFFGIFFMVFATSTIWGNLISYFVLNQTSIPQKVNCGIHFDPVSATDTDKSNHVNDVTRYVLCGILAGMGVISMILLFFFLDQIRLNKPQHVKQSLKKSLEVLRSLVRWKHIDQLFLIPLTMWSMMEGAFLAAQFTRAFVTCLVGIRFIGLVFICNGICNATFSYIYGGLVKYIGRLGCFIIAASFNYAVLILMYFWEPMEEQMYILFIMAGLWGVAAAAWQSQVVAVYTVLYAETDSSAIAKYRLWKSVGSLLTYCYASYVNIEYTIIILLIFLTISMISYGVVEIHIRWKNRTTKSNALNDSC